METDSSIVLDLLRAACYQEVSWNPRSHFPADQRLSALVYYSSIDYWTQLARTLHSSGNRCAHPINNRWFSPGNQLLETDPVASGSESLRICWPTSNVEHLGENPRIQHLRA